MAADSVATASGHPQVTHYSFGDCSDFTPMHADPYYGSIAFRRLVDITGGNEVPNQYGGYRVAEAFIDKVQYHIRDSTMQGGSAQAHASPDTSRPRGLCMFMSKSLAAGVLGLLSALAFAQQSTPRQLVLYRPSTSTFFIRTGESNQPARELVMGAAGDIPLWADFNGDGKGDPAVYRKGHWLISTHADGNADVMMDFGGQAGDIPLVADVDNDGRPDLVVFRAGEWDVRGTRNPAVMQVFHFGMAGDIPLLADFDGDGRIDFAVFRAGEWYVDTDRDGKADLTLSFGGANDRPLAGDWNGNRRVAQIVFRDGQWLVSEKRDGKASAQVGFGAKGDIPLAVWTSR